jgi:choline transport protein
MGEETKSPKVAVPRALFWSIATNAVLGLIMIITFGVCIPSMMNCQ